MQSIENTAGEGEVRQESEERINRKKQNWTQIKKKDLKKEKQTQK